MSLKRNIITSYISQFYATLIGIFLIPMYVRYMGVEAYGLIGFFAMLQAWISLLDMGLTQTLARETARFFKGSDEDALQLRRLVHSLECIFMCMALVGCIAMILGSGSIAGSWLKVRQLPLQEVQRSISLMAVTFGLRLVCNLYRGAITGFERLVWLSGLNVALATARYVLVIPVFIFVGTTPTDFFAYQLAIAVLETIILANQTYRLLPKINSLHRLFWQWGPLRALLKFSLSMAVTNMIWVAVTQTDKLLLSKLLPLDEFACFSLATTLASGLFMLSTPISAALLPRLTRLAAEQNQPGLIGLYRESTQLVGVIVIPAVLVLSLFAKQVVLAWTGNADFAQKVAPILSLYALGNGIVALASFPYYLQAAKGDLRLHVIGNVLLCVILIPALVWGTLHYGAIGAGYAWTAVNALFFLFGAPAVHRRFVKGLHTQWLLWDIGVIALSSSAVATVIFYSFSWPSGRLAVGVCILILSALLLAVSSASSSQMRAKIGARWRFLVESRDEKIT
ncbi:MAG: lipopolysaccharide biosynthesis protein [Burkholderiales bacterium]